MSLITVKEAAEMLRIKPYTVRVLIQKGKLNAIRVPGTRKLLFELEEIKKNLLSVVRSNEQRNKQEAETK